MIDYCILGVIFVFTFFALWAYIKLPFEEEVFFKAGLILSISAGTIYLLSKFILDTYYTSYILCAILVFESFLLLKIIPTYPKKAIKTIMVIYIIFIGISLLVGRGCYNSKLREAVKLQVQDSLQNSKATFISQFTFDIDSLSATLKYPSEITLGAASPKLLIYKKTDNKLSYFYELSKRFDPGTIAFKIEELNTIIIIENTTSDIGMYDNHITMAKKITTNIYFIDFHSMKIILQKSIEGLDPPQTIKYHRSAEESVTGKAPTEDEVFEEIIKVIK